MYQINLIHEELVAMKENLEFLDASSISTAARSRVSEIDGILSVDDQDESVAAFSVTHRLSLTA